MTLTRNFLALALLATPALADGACTAETNCTVIAAAPVDPITAQCFGDRERLLTANAEQAALIADLTARVQRAEAEAEKPAPPPPKKKHHRKRRKHK